MIKLLIYQEVAIINGCVPNKRTQKYSKNLWYWKEKNDNSTIIGSFNNPFSIIDRTTRQEVRKDILCFPENKT